MNTQLDIFSGQPEIEWLHVNRLPSMDTLLQHCGKAFRELSIVDDKQLLKTWESVNIANYCLRRNIEPKGYDYSQRHLLPQLGSPDLVKTVEKELKKRGLDKFYGLDIELRLMNRQTQ